MFFIIAISHKRFAIDTGGGTVICSLKHGRKHMLTILPTIWTPGLRPCFHDIGLLVMQDLFPESSTKTLWSMSVYTMLGKQPSDTISCQNNFTTSTTFVVFFTYLPSN